MDEFLKAFWPNFVSTVLGLVLGLPLALLVNRRVISHSEQLKQQSEQTQLNTALKILRQTLAANRGRLSVFVETLSNSKAPFNTMLDTTAWEAVRIEVTRYLHNPELQGRIAYHFSQLAALAKLNDSYIDFSAGVAAAIGGSEQTRTVLRSYLVKSAEALDAGAKEITTLIENSKTRSVAKIGG